MTDNKKVPRLRFKEFTDAWEQRKLNDEYQKIGNAFVGTASPYYVENGHFYLESNNIKNGQINHDHEIFINDSFFKKQADKYLHTGDLVMVQSGHVGDTAVITKKYNNTAAHALIMFRNPKHDATSTFLNYYFQSDNAKSKISVLSIGNTISHILASDISRFTVSFPKNVEQEKITKLFSSLQNLITLHQRKQNQLKKVKKALLQKMFADEKNPFPFIRFKGFTEAWEQRKLGEVSTIVGGGTPSTKNSAYWGGTINWYSPAEIDDQIYVNNSQRKITELGLSKSSASLLPIGTVLFTSRAGIGKTAILGKKACTNQGFQSIIPNKKELDSYFVYTMTAQLKRYGETHGAGSTFVEVSGKQMAKMPVVLPKYEEQIQISFTFKQLDSLVALHQRKLDQLQKLKKSLLQNMFI